MIVPDINLLLYAYNDASPYHDAACQWWEKIVNGNDIIGVPWVVSTGFIRLMTNRRVLTSPVSTTEAIAYVQEWFQYANVTPLNPGPEHLLHLRRVLDAVGVGANLVSDAHIAALAIERNAELHSNDSDFARFPGLLWRNPLETRSNPTLRSN